MIRLHFVVEGQTEETFVNQTLVPHLSHLSVFSDARCVETSRKRGVKYRGGGSYGKVRNDIARWTREDRGSDARFTTMFDLYGLPSGFPGHESAPILNDPRQRVKMLESAFKDDIGDWRFIPYIQLHEFEALLLSAPNKLAAQFHDSAAGIRRLAGMASRYSSPELIDDGAETAPSKRIIAEIPEYSGRKASAGPLVANNIGLDALRLKCEHFGDWLDKLERLSAADSRI